MRTPLLRAALAASLLSLPTPAQIDPETAAAIRRAGLEESQVMEILDELTNGIGQRMTGSDNFTQACEWAAAEFREMGLSNVQLEKWDTWPIVWNRGQWMGRALTPEPMELQVATEAYVNGTRGRERGPAIRTPQSVEELAAIEDQLDGAWLVGELPNPRGEFFSELLERTYGRIHGFAYPSSAGRSRRGQEPEYPNRMRVFSSSTMRGRVPNFESAPEESTRIMVRKDQMDRILEMVDQGQPVELEFDIRNRWRAEPIDLHNVIAEIPGTEKPEEVVVVCGHLDSWHQATGTTDNGTGTASTMETARILMSIGAQPKRTIRFCLWGGEEQGLLGSNRHTTMRRDELDKISAVFNHDTGTNWAQSLTVTPGMADMLRPVFEPVMELTPPDADFDRPVFELRETEQMRGGGGSDHASFLGKGVPGLSWGLTGRSDYFGYTWHTQWDTYDVAIPEYMRHNATVFAMAALGTANLPEMLPREGIGRARGTDTKPVLEQILGMDLGGENDLTVTGVNDGGIAKRWGLQSGDVLHSIGTDRIESLGQLRLGLRAIQQADEGSRSGTLTVRRDEELVVLKIGL